MKKITALVLALTLALSLTACGGSSDTGADSTPNDTTDTSASSAPSMRAEDLAGGWVDDDGNTLVIDTEDGTYGYRTYYGRVGRGDYTEDAGKPMLDYDNFNYDLLSVDGGLTLRQNGSSDREGLDGAHFGQGESELYEWPIDELGKPWSLTLAGWNIWPTARTA